MAFEPWMLAAMEEHGYMDTYDGKINRLAIWLKNNMIGTVVDQEIFDQACEACQVDSGTFTQNDLNRMLDKLNSL